MADTVKSRNREVVLSAARFIEEHQGEDTVVLDISEESSFTDYFIIAGVTSEGHVRGLCRNLSAFLSDRGVHIPGTQKHAVEYGWTLIDCGFFVIHLMDQEHRDFYELERLWHAGKILYPPA
ncbi:MAG TPA: ribosome silencing factor [Spirochaetia bacterium]|nr:ribosome silencing factor [Spirochaetia bacterium]